MSQVFNLYRLQQIDSQIDQTTAGIAEIDRLLAGDEQIMLAKQQAEEHAAVLKQCRQQLKEAEFAVHEQQIKISQSEASLYGGRNRTPKELQDLQKEIVSLKKYLTVVEDHQLEKMMALEAAETDQIASQAALTQAQAAFAETSAVWFGRKDVLLHSLQRLNAERSAALTLVEPNSLTTYDNLRKRKSGVAVTSIKDGSCVVCGANIRPAELQSARAASNLVYCSTCGRILYAG